MKVKLSKDAEKRLDKLPSSKRQKVTDKLVVLGSNPFLGKKLGGKFSDYHSLRVWPYSIIYQINKLQRVVIIITVEHRQGAYK
ncbi:MAG: type II toxin-antitoxin system RelE/ParE family toxin [Patescibacteria group bacterium]|nr:type II toxin-antitoxin system RelE/ParE family toxin [Patescibacteria group bacterium]